MRALVTTDEPLLIVTVDFVIFVYKLTILGCLHRAMTKHKNHLRRSIQNFKLPARERKLGVNVSFDEWVFDREYCRRLGVPDKERRIVAVLDGLLR
ncbi:hypothetical protein [Paenibacillus oleatilyticus]|uniref:hypothetical protein n=1 Tax=Paenibacillus oleatilyticus TaxID=2594886 RepID=UPI001C1FFC71|nr:hypothetical protein [Paenibacillus oleatilyticus]MBU7318438.1 hypothetical protein [Paenibacillus oleatilyticus]